MSIESCKQKHKNKTGTMKGLEVMNMFITLIVGNGVMSVWICTQTVHTKLVQFLIFQHHLSKTIFELPGRH